MNLLPKINICILTLGILFFYPNRAAAQTTEQGNSTLLYSLLNEDDDKVMHEVLKHPEKFSFQLIYIKLRNVNGKFTLEKHSLFEDQHYFYPASLIKFPLMILMLEHLTSLKKYGCNLDSRISLKTCSCDKATESYVRNSKLPTIRQFMREMMIMSNNDAYNLFFDMVGMDKFNKKYKGLGYKGLVLKSRFTKNCSKNRWSGGVNFYNSSDSLIWSIPCDSSALKVDLDSSLPVTAGLFHYENGKKITGPNTFSPSNYVLLSEATDLLVKLFYPEKKPDFDIDSSFLEAFKNSLGSFPRELENSEYPTRTIPDHYYKFFLNPQLMKTSNGQLRIYNKVGLASSFLSDISYFYDKENDIRFFLSGSILAKPDGIINGGSTDYQTYGMQLFRKIGGLIYQYEKIYQESLKNK